MQKRFNLTTSFKAVSSDDKVKISGYASTDTKDRAWDVILPEAWAKGLDNYKKNPILLFNHNYSEPIGKTTSIDITDKGLFIEAEISKAGASKVASLIEDEVLKAFSVGFSCKDAEYDSATDTFVIKEAELYEVSVVAVPCNQDAIFSVSKSFDSEEELKKFKEEICKVEHTAEDSVNAQDSVDDSTKSKEKLKMNEEQLAQLLKDAAAEAAKSVIDAEAEKVAKKEQDAKEAEDFKIQVKTAAESLLEDVEKRFSEKNESLESLVAELKEDLKAKSEEIQAIQKSKRTFAAEGSADWKKEFLGDMEDAVILGLATNKGLETELAKEVLQKVNTQSGIEVSSDEIETVVSSNIEKDIQNELVLARLFRELPMTSATMVLPIMPDAGYASFTNTGSIGSANLGDRDGVNTDKIKMQERTVSTKKLISLTYLGNDTEEDAIIPLLPLLRDALVRSQARSVENAILLGNHADGAFGTSGDSFDGLITLAEADGQVIQPSGTFAATDVITAEDLLQLRKGMGKYGLRPEDVVYIVSSDAYFNLLEDTEFQDANLVGAIATKIKGSIGKVYGSNVLVCDEFVAKAAAKHNAVAVNTRNFLVPRLKGVSLETEYRPSEQRRAIVATQRLGFIDLIDGAASKYALKYKNA